MQTEERRLLSHAPRAAGHIWILLFLILTGALLVRVINLGADPPALINRDVITDEGWWAHNVRNVLHHGQWRIDDYNPGIYSASLHTSLLYVLMKWLGPELTSVRLLSALAGWLTVVLLFLWLRREVSMRAGLIAALLLGFSNLDIMYSRSGFVESTMVFFLALALWLWSMRQRHSLFALLSGLAFGLLMLTKVTAVYLAPGLVFLALAERVRKRIGRRDAMIFGSGVVVVGAAYLLFFVIPNFHEWVGYNLAAATGDEWPRQASDLVYCFLKILTSPFYSELPILTGLALLAFGRLIIRVSRQGVAATVREASDVEILGMSLLLGYFLSLAPTLYQPERRFIPVSFLMAALAAVVLDYSWQRGKEPSVSADRMGPAGWFVSLFFLPAVGIINLQWEALGTPLTVRFWAIKAAFISLLVIASVALSRSRLPARITEKLLAVSRLGFLLLFFYLTLGVVMTGLSVWGVEVTAGRPFASGDANRLLISLVFIVLLAVMSKGTARTGGRLAVLLLALFLLVEGVRISTWLLRPTYTLMEANRILAGMMGENETVVTRYETLLLSSRARVVCYWPREGFNVNAFEQLRPGYILILRRDDWRDFALEEMSPEEWPPPVKQLPTKVTSFDLCPTPARGPRFILELYRMTD